MFDERVKIFHTENWSLCMLVFPSFPFILQKLFFHDFIFSVFVSCLSAYFDSMILVFSNRTGMIDNL